MAHWINTLEDIATTLLCEEMVERRIPDEGKWRRTFA
jgi:hypothetical protein